MSRRIVSLRKCTRSSYVYTSGRPPTKKQPTTVTTPKTKHKKRKTITAEWKRGKIVFSRGGNSSSLSIKWIWYYLIPIYDRPSREVYWVGKIYSERGLSHPKIWILGWKKKKTEKREHQHSPPLCPLTLDTMWPAASYSYHNGERLPFFFFVANHSLLYWIVPSNHESQ